MGGGGGEKDIQIKEKTMAFVPGWTLAGKTKTVTLFSSCKAKSHIVLFPPPRFFFLHKALQLEEGAGGGQVVRRKDGKGEGCSGLK